MTGRLATIAVALTLSASLASAGQARQRWAGGGQSSGSQSSGQSSAGQSAGGASSGQSSGGQATARPAAPPAASRSTPPAAAPAPTPPTRSGGTQLQRWAARSESTPPPTTTPRQESSGRSAIERLGMPRPQPTPQATPGSGTTQLQRWGLSRNDQAPTVTAPQQESSSSTLRRLTSRAESTPLPQGASGGTQIQRWGVTRNENQDNSSAQPAQPSRAAIPRVRSAPLTTTPSTPVVDDDTARSSQRVAEPRQRYPNPENGTARVAVPRGSVPSVNPQPSGGGTIVYDRGARVYHNYYYYSRSSYPYGYGSYGLGYFYYDPYGWYDPYPVYYPGPTYTGGYYDPRYGYGTGEIRLQVRPRDADVYVDGFYAGRVDEFDGFVQSLRIEEGPHTIEIVAPGYEPLVFSVRIVAGRKINYRRDLIPYRR